MERKIRRFKDYEPYWFSAEDKRLIIEEYLSSGMTKRFIWEKYTGRKEEKGKLVSWMRSLGYDVPKKVILRFSQSDSMMMNRDFDNGEALPRNVSELEAENRRLKKALEEAEQKAYAYSKLIDVAEKMFNIPIRKKPNTKP